MDDDNDKDEMMMIRWYTFGFDIGTSIKWRYFHNFKKLKPQASMSFSVKVWLLRNDDGDDIVMMLIMMMIMMMRWYIFGSIIFIYLLQYD